MTTDGTDSKNALQPAPGAKSHAICGAKTRSGAPCKSPPVRGSTRCRMHGGTNPGRPIVHGRYSLKHRKSLAAKAETFAEFEGDLSAELQLLRALLQDFLDRYEDGVPLPADEIQKIYDFADTIGRMEERRVKIRHDTAFGAQEMQLFIAAMAGVLQKFVPADDLPEALNELRTILSSH